MPRRRDSFKFISSKLSTISFQLLYKLKKKKKRINRMYKLTSPEFQNPHPFLTSMTPSGSIPSGPPCSLQTRRLHLETIPSPTFQTIRMALYNPSHIGLPSPARVRFLLKGKQDGAAGLITYLLCAYQKVRNSFCRSSAEAADPSPQPRRSHPVGWPSRESSTR